MLALPWIVFALLALFWTGGAAMTAWAVDWMAQALADGGAVQAAGELAALPVPQWIALWLDPALVQAGQSALQWALEAGRGLLPLAGSAAGWLVPLVWVAWALGLVVLLAGAAGVHLLVRRMGPRALAR
jgi:hypothetical protein